MNKKVIGDKGEEEAVRFLVANGYEVIERNWRWRRSEIDIIARFEEAIVFVEVKSRKNEDFGLPEDFLSADQQDRIHLASEVFCEQIGWSGHIRFDIIAILESQFPNHLEHLEDAF